MYYLDDNTVTQFTQSLKEEELAHCTIYSYVKSVSLFKECLDPDYLFDKETVIGYKNALKDRYCPETVNVHVAGLNHFFKTFHFEDCIVKAEKIQMHSMRPAEKVLTKQDYFSLIEAAELKKKERIALIIQTLGSTGIRIGELPFVTVESLKDRRIRINNKGKHRIVLMPEKLCVKLQNYSRDQGLESGPIFVTRTHKNIHPKNISKELKKLCVISNVPTEKVFPHNFRHLFASTHYEQEKDLPRLADILGHSNINTTRLYILKNTAEQCKILDSLDLVSDLDE